MRRHLITASSFLFWILTIGQLHASTFMDPGACPYNVRDNESQSILESNLNNISSEIDRINHSIQDNEQNCNLPPVNEVAKSTSLIREISLNLVPPKRSFESLFIAGQTVNCTVSSQELEKIVLSYKEFTLGRFRKLPENYGDLEQYLNFDGESGKKINQAFFDCHSKSLEKNNTEISFLSSCIDSALFSVSGSFSKSIVDQIWSDECYIDFETASKDIQSALNDGAVTEAKARTVEELLNQSYNQISGTLDLLLSNVNSKCKLSNQFANVSNSLITSAIGLGQAIGQPWTGLALNLAAKPISSLINKLTNKGLREQENQLNDLYDKIIGIDRQKRDNYLCSLISMQNLKCDTLRPNNDKHHNFLCSESTSSIELQKNNLEEFGNILSFLREGIDIPESFKDISDSQLNLAYDNESDVLFDLYETFFDPVSGLYLHNTNEAKDFSGEDSLSFFDYFYGEKGVISNLKSKVSGNKSKLSLREKGKINNKINSAKIFKEKLLEFKSKLEKVASSANKDDKASVIESYKSIVAMIPGRKTLAGAKSSSNKLGGVGGNDYNEVGVSPMDSESIEGQMVGFNINNGSYSNGTSQNTTSDELDIHPVDFTFLLETFYTQKLKEGPKNELYKYAMDELSAVARSKIEAANEKTLLTAQISDRGENMKSFFDFMSDSYVRDNVLEPLLNEEVSKESVPEDKEKRQKYFALNKYSTLRDCLFLYQPIYQLSLKSVRGSSQTIEKYSEKCQAVIRCQKDLGIELNLSNNEKRGNQNSEIVNFDETADYDKFSPICKINKNYGLIFSKAEANFKEYGRLCE